MPDPKTILMVIGVLALVVASHWVRSWVEPDVPRDTTPDTVRVDRPMTLDDLVDPVMPETVTEYKTPDSTQTECFQAPLWLDTLTQTGYIAQGQDTPSKTPTQPISDTAQSFGGEIEGENHRGVTVSLDGPPYVITPTTNGRPTLSVGPKQVTLSALLPTGQGRTYHWDVPEPNWTIDAAGTVTASRAAAVGTSALYLIRHSERFEFGIGPAGHMVVTDGGYAAEPALSLRIETTLYSF